MFVWFTKRLLQNKASKVQSKCVSIAIFYRYLRMEFLKFIFFLYQTLNSSNFPFKYLLLLVEGGYPYNMLRYVKKYVAIDHLIARALIYFKNDREMSMDKIYVWFFKL